MSTRYVNILSKRHPSDDDDDDDVGGDQFGGWFYSEEGRKVRYGILLGIIIFFIAFVLFSYQHAQMRMNKGLAPLPYHSWLVSGKRRRQFEPEDRSEPPPRPAHPEDNFSFYQNEHQLYVVPPPAYNPNFVQPPSYSGPPEGATKAAPQQHQPPAYPGNGHGNPASAAGPSSAEQRY